MATGVDDEVTLRANREAFQRFQLRPRRLIDVSRIDMRNDILGTMYDSPIVISPTLQQQGVSFGGRAGGREGSKGRQPSADIVHRRNNFDRGCFAARGAPVWFQLYPTQKWEVAEALAKRAERAGSPVIVVTLDVLARQNWETLFRLRPYGRPSMWDLSWQDHAGLRRPQTQLRWDRPHRRQLHRHN